MKDSSGNRIRIKDIALKAGVSAGTVDRVLHNRGEVAVKTREQILDIVNELDYTPNILAKSLASKKLFVIAALIPSTGKENSYWEKPWFGIEQASSEIKDYNTRVLLFTYDPNIPESLRTIFGEVLNINPDGIILAPLAYSSSLEIISECDSRNIPYVFIDVNLDGHNNLAFFGQNAGQSGFLAAKLMYLGLPENSYVLVVKPESKESIGSHLHAREKGFISYFLSPANKKNILTHTTEVDFTGGDITQKFDSILNEISAIKGIFVTNSRAFKVAHFLYERKINDITLIGYDLIKKNLDYLERGVIDFLIGQKPEEQGYKSVLTLFNYLISGKRSARINYSPIDIIMKENIDYYKNFKF